MFSTKSLQLLLQHPYLTPPETPMIVKDFICWLVFKVQKTPKKQRFVNLDLTG